MPDILHAVGVKASPDAVYDALTTLKGLAAWWTTDTTGDAGTNGTIKFRFGDKSTVHAKVEALKRGELVLWEVLDAQPEWVGTKIRFELSHDKGVTLVLFKHEGWKEQTRFMHHCSTKWAVFLLSLKALLETGAGSPFPHDTQINS